MTEKLYRICVNEDSYSYSSDDYDGYVKRVQDDIAKNGIFASQRTVRSPESLKEVHIDNAWRAVGSKRYSDIKPAERYIISMYKHYPFLEFFIEKTELNWRKV